MEHFKSDRKCRSLELREGKSGTRPLGTELPRQPNWRADLNCPSCSSEMRKPFDVLAEGLISKNSRGDRTAIELFLAGIQGWQVDLERFLILKLFSGKLQRRGSFAEAV
jgi:hypothetical protein